MIIPTLSSRRLVGREAEIHSLGDARRELAKGRGCVVLIAGEAGIGKTRLVNEFAASLTSARAPRFFVGECLQDAPRPFGPFRTLLSQLAGFASTTLVSQSPLVARTLAALVPDASQANRIPVASPVVVEKAELFAGTLRFLEDVAAKRGVVLTLEDLHWADSATLELLLYLAPRIAGTRLMIIGTYRDDEITKEHTLFSRLARLERGPTVRRMELEPLVEQDVRSLIRAALGTKYTLTRDQVRDVVTRAEGNPFFAEEILKKAVERGQRSAAASQLPTSVRALTLERLTGLNASDRRVLDFAAVFGLHVDADTIATLMELDRREVLRSLRHLRDANLVFEVGAGSPEFRFRHVLTRQVVYDELLATDTRELHARIASRLQSLSDSTSRVDQIAYHAWRAGDGAATLRYSEQAGDLALAISAGAQAASYFERALDAAVHDDRARSRLLGKAGEAYVQQSDFGNASARCLEQHALLVKSGDLGAAAHALTRGAAEIANSGDVHRALGLLEDFRAQHGDALPGEDADHLNAAFGRLATACDAYDRAQSALACVRHPERLAAFSHQVYWLAQLFCAEHFVDRALWKRAAAALRARNHETLPLMRSQMLHSIASTAVTFGENEEALRSVDEAIDIDRELGYSRALAFASAVKSCVLCLLGKLADARACMVTALSEPDTFVVRLELALGASPAAVALDDRELADRCLDDKLLADLRAAHMDAAAAAMEGMQAARSYARGRLDEARRLLDSSVDGVAHQFNVVHLWPFAARLVDAARLVRLQSLCSARAANTDDRVSHACAALLDAYAARRENDSRTEKLADVAATRYRALGWPLFEAQALEVGGRAHEAIDLYRACGSITDVRRLEMRGQPAKRRVADGTRLSPREREVATLVAQGMSNRKIANTLSVGEKTVEKYVTAIYAKLGFSTRAQLAAHVARGESSEA